jgi:integrase
MHPDGEPFLDSFRADRQSGPRLASISSPRLTSTFCSTAERCAVCNPHQPQEALAVRILIGSGLRRAELCGLCVEAPDGLSDLLLDSLDRGVAEIRVRPEAGAKGMRARRVPVVPKLATEIRRYVAKYRPDVDYPQLLINEHEQPYGRWGIQSLMTRLAGRAGFRVHAHAFRHTFATVATKLGWNFERLRAAMGHADYMTLQRYVWMSTQADLGRLEDWTEFIAIPPTVRLGPQQGWWARW